MSRPTKATLLLDDLDSLRVEIRIQDQKIASLYTHIADRDVDLSTIKRKLDASQEHVRVLLDRLQVSESKTPPLPVDPLDGPAMLSDILRRLGNQDGINFCTRVMDRLVKGSPQEFAWYERRALLLAHVVHVVQPSGIRQPMPAVGPDKAP